MKPEYEEKDNSDVLLERFELDGIRYVCEHSEHPDRYGNLRMRVQMHSSPVAMRGTNGPGAPTAKWSTGAGFFDFKRDIESCHLTGDARDPRAEDQYCDCLPLGNRPSIAHDGMGPEEDWVVSLEPPAYGSPA